MHDRPAEHVVQCSVWPPELDSLGIDCSVNRISMGLSQLFKTFLSPSC